MKLIIAIDGYSSCGKSTLAKQLAEKLNYTFIDTGAMYRAITLYFLRNNVRFTNTKNVKDALSRIQIHLERNATTKRNEIFLNGENVSDAVREMLIAEKVSEIAAIKSVREFAVAQQRKMGVKGGVVMDGRDIGTVVFPHADLKIFMTADVAIRVKRRFLELQEKQLGVTLEEVKTNLELRDYMDSNREESPLRKADDARVLDNSDLTPKQQLERVLDWVNDLINKKKSTSVN